MEKNALHRFGFGDTDNESQVTPAFRGGQDLASERPFDEEGPTVGFVHNEDGRSSKLRHLTIEDYRAEKARMAG